LSGKLIEFLSRAFRDNQMIRGMQASMMIGCSRATALALPFFWIEMPVFSDADRRFVFHAGGHIRRTMACCSGGSN
jgi:hypothetical protein